MHDKTRNELREAVLEDIPMKGGRVDANAHRIQQSRNLKSAILLLLDTNISFDKHVEDNKESFQEIKQANKLMRNSGLIISGVFAVAIIGIVANWTLASGLAVFGTVIKGLSMLLGKS